MSRALRMHHRDVQDGGIADVLCSDLERQPDDPAREIDFVSMSVGRLGYRLVLSFNSNAVQKAQHQQPRDGVPMPNP
jgi:hypothetical protein